MTKWFSLLGATFLISLTSCSVERLDRCKTVPTACPGLIGKINLSLINMTPVSQALTILPTTVVATFSEAVVDLAPEKFVISGTCANLPTVSSVAMNTEKTTASASLTGAVCLNNETFTVTVTPASITSLSGNVGAGSALSRTYTMIALGPVATLATPSLTRMKSSASSTIALTYTGATTTSLTNAGVSKNETGVSCTVNVTGASAAGATLTVSGCTGNGTITVSVNAGTAADASGNLSTASPVSAAITIDNTAPTLQTLTPANSTMVAIPSEVVATFSEAVNSLVPSNFTIGGTCSPRPTVSGVTMSASDTVATAALTGGTCAESQTVTVTLNPADATDLAGNAGTGGSQTRTYTISTAGPTATLAAPSSTLINSSGTSTVDLTYNGAVATTLTNAGITKTEVGVSCTVSVSGVSPAGATLTIASCTGSGTIRVRVNAGTATNSLGNASSASADSAVITVDNTGPTLSSLTPNSANRVTMPASVIATFSEAMTTLATSKFVVSGTCSTLPSVTGVNMSASDTVATAAISGAVCTLGQTLTVTVDPTTVTDAAGNVGTGSTTAVTYTKINGTGAITISGPHYVGDTSCTSQSKTYTISSTGTADAEVTDVSMSGGLMSISADNCTVANGGPGVLAPGDSCTVDVEADFNTNGSDDLVIQYNNQTTTTSTSYSLNADANGC
ncbi:MAG: hypothetical protein KF799_00515 [Bdellovibrionales bacterium]|nr:hypothetical protein [Bdellovibrionales bacterium]